MKKTLICLFVILNTVSFPVLSYGKMTVDKKLKNAELSLYEELYLQNIDLRGLRFSVYDDEEDEYDPEPLSDKLLNELALELYEHFFVQLKDQIKINESESVDQTKKSLILNVKLAGQFEYEDKGALMRLVLKNNQIETILHLECELLDSQSGEVLYIVKDEHSLISPVADQPLTQKSELDSISNIFRVWSTRFTKVFNKMRLE